MNCPRCGGSMRSHGRVQNATPTDHHNGIYECGQCGRVVVSG